ncbi:MAG TPA: glycosyltransferase family 39 protein [Anaerolineales bacterium]|nr:glycosyltransferase family 39 protein [Anaerolineales bacterium]
MKRSIAVVIFLLWIGIIVSAYYVVQKPGLLNAFTGLIGTLWTFIVAGLLLFNAYGIGRRILSWLGLQSANGIERLLLGCGIGLGALGLLGLFFSALQLADERFLTLFQVALAAFFIFGREFINLRLDFKSLSSHSNLSFSQFNLFSRIAIIFPWALAFLLTLVPPFEAFDALLYHLAQPARILQDGGLRAIDITPFWFPSLSQSTYLWALAMGSERAAQMLHLAWGVLSVLLLWRWAVKVWDIEIGRKTLLLLAGLPSLPMLASWAYADMALVFYASAALYALRLHGASKSFPWLWAAAVLTGLAMGVKYTSFTVPLAGGLLILFWWRRELIQAICYAVRFSVLALLVALPWYARNALMMGNPFYPFVFGGRYWDSFLSAWYADAGTGIGWNAIRVLLLPLNVVLGHRDVTFFDGRLGPIFLILAPFTLWILLSGPYQDSDRDISLRAIGLFAVISFGAWTIGVINSASLWQARLLLPALVPFAIPSALGWDSLRRLDTPAFRISFLANVVIAMVIALSLFDNAMFALQRNPLAVALGAQTREQYIARINPSYAALIQRLDGLPGKAYIYSLFEPRSYGLPRHTQPDAINYNFAHDHYLYKTPSEIIRHWKTAGYTHVIVYERGLEFIANDPSGKLTPSAQAALQEVLTDLELIDQTPDKVYTIYRIPQE